MSVGLVLSAAVFFFFFFFFPADEYPFCASVCDQRLCDSRIALAVHHHALASEDRCGVVLCARGSLGATPSTTCGATLVGCFFFIYPDF